METLYWQDHTLYLLDQTKLPSQETYLACSHWQDVRDAIRCRASRGAPAIGVAAAFGIVLAARQAEAAVQDKKSFMDALTLMGRELADARPTAVNLHWAVERMLKNAKVYLIEHDIKKTIVELEGLARLIRDEDIETNRRMAAYGAEELARAGKPLTILTHCNAGALATAGIGTALGVVRALHERGIVKMVYADETRPVLQGARLTVTELMADHIPVTLITDNMAAWVMRTKGVDAVIVGADRIAANGDTANKIGTYGVALLARAHGIPFYIAAPVSTFDLTRPTGQEIPIEERPHGEVRSCGGMQTALSSVPVFNPAFDVTPHEYITGIITERGVLHHPDTRVLSSFFRKEA